MAGKYVKAVYDFRTSESGEICLTVGDIVEVVRQIDDNWLCGKLHGQVGICQYLPWCHSTFIGIAVVPSRTKGFPRQELQCSLTNEIRPLLM